jgi:lysozyme
MAKKSKRKKTGKKNKGWLIVLMIVVVLLVYTIFTYIQQTRENAAEFVRYPAFGIDIPQGYHIHGIDVSWYQGYISWPAVKNMTVRDVQIGFAFIKATEGLNKVDKHFKRNWMKAGEAGIARGAYHFFISTKSG